LRKPALIRVMKPLVRLVALLLVSLPSRALAQTPADLRQSTLEDLMNSEIVSASRKEPRIVETPAAVSVITHDDIRRSGATTLIPRSAQAQLHCRAA
jgi:iron complex outermembrane receptor protein